MKRTIALACILIVAILLFCSCDGSFDLVTISGDGFNKPTISPYKPQTIDTKDTTTFTVYVCGAVQNEGYYVVEQGTTIADAIALAGILPQTIFPQNATTYIKFDCQIAVQYSENGTKYNCMNVNSMFVWYNLSYNNIPSEVIAKLHDYYVNHGPITSKQMVKQILNEEQYQQNHYKIYVAEVDYVSGS